MEVYKANVLWSLAGAVFHAMGGDFPVKSWSDLNESRETESAEDLRQTLIERWGGGDGT